MKLDNREWLNEYQEFLNLENARVPPDLAEKVMKRMDRILNPKASSVFMKIVGIHAVVGFFSLAICRQFDVNPFGTSFSLADVFMRWGGHSVCMIFCGVLYTSLTLAAAGFFLSIEEMRALQRTEFIQALSLSILSLGVFALFGAELALSFAGLWLLGALIGGFLSIESSFWLRSRALAT